MDINDLRVLIMVAAFAAFVGIMLWAWSGRRRDRFEAAARLPFDDDGASPQATEQRDRQ